MKTKPLAVIVVAVILAVGRAHAAPWDTIVVGSQSEAQRLATIDLQRYLAQVTGVVAKQCDAATWQSQPVPAIVIGTAATNPLLAGIPEARQDLGEQGYVLANTTLSGRNAVIAAGQTELGAVNAVYGLLRELGYGFFLGSEAAPETLPLKLPAERAIVRKPVFGIRGVLPWYNFFDSPTTWDPIDHRAVVDQLLRSGANFIGFHSYDSEPFAAYEEGGEMKMGGRLLNTKSPTWGPHPMPTREFAFGTDKLFADDYFGAATTQSNGDPGAVIRREQDIVRDAFNYAKRRGVRTCIGFEVTGDPTNPLTCDVVIKRLNRLLDEYPAADYLWIWQSEAQAGPGYREESLLRDKFAPGSALEPYTVARRQAFRRIADTTLNRGDYLKRDPASRAARAREGARLEQFARLAYRVIHQRQGAPRLVISGWGGDEYLCSEEYYEGLDRLLPRDVVFSSLDIIQPHARVDAIYGDFAPDRQRWPIPWLECDGDQWHPQPNVHIYEGVASDAQRKGCQGLLGIHWRTRDIEENLAFLVDYAWQPWEGIRKAPRRAIGRPSRKSSCPA
ncbi:MAG: alpha-glucuronidase family glycosyl hydrolase [Thermoguttaceae bacterium]